jgi:glycosyltransferase involved in cell wall biosynthesis
MSLKILLAHNYYQQPGGEDTAFESEVNLLRERGHQVVEYIDNNDRIKGMNSFLAAAQTHWSRDSYNKITVMLKKERPAIAHFHNIFPLISPSAYFACQSLEIPVIQSLDNPRLLCPAASLYRDGHLCQDCIGKTPPWPSILHNCYRNSRSQTAVVASMLTLHRMLGTWQNKVNFFLVATNFYRRKFAEGGLPKEKLAYKPHFIYPDPGMHKAKKIGRYALFVARLDPEKGVRVMLKAWEHLDIPLIIRGSGQLESETQDWIKHHPNAKVKIIGRLPREELSELMGNARFLVWPSQGYYETFGYSAVECFANGVPVIASKEGVMEEIVSDRCIGLHFQTGNAEDLAEKVRWLWDHPEESKRMGRDARMEYENKFTADKNYEMLMQIYEDAIRQAPL